MVSAPFWVAHSSGIFEITQCIGFRSCLARSSTIVPIGSLAYLRNLFIRRRTHIRSSLKAIAPAEVVGRRWISAPGALRRNSFVRIVVAVQSGRDLRWRHAVFYPARHGRDNIVLGIPSRRGLTERAADRVWARSTHTMTHSRSQKQSIEGLNAFKSAHPRCNRLVISDRRACRDRRICPAMVLNQLPAAARKAVRPGFTTSTALPALRSSA